MYSLLYKDVHNKNNEHYFISPISILCKLCILKDILNNYKKIIDSNLSTKESFPKDLIIDYLIMNINNSKNNIKDNCKEICRIAFELFGSEIFTEKLSFLDKKNFEKLFKIKSLEPMMKSISKNNLDSSNKNSRNNSANKNKNNNKKRKADKECSLCRQIIQTGTILSHMRECPMCCRCKKCKNFVEIKYLTNHKLYDCKYKNEFKLCIRCKEAVHKNLYKKHIENKSCNPFKQNYNRCPLCHEDIPSSNKGFFQHFMKDGCPIRNKMNNNIEEGA